MSWPSSMSPRARRRGAARATTTPSPPSARTEGAPRSARDRREIGARSRSRREMRARSQPAHVVVRSGVGAAGAAPGRAVATASGGLPASEHQPCHRHRPRWPADKCKEKINPRPCRLPPGCSLKLAVARPSHAIVGIPTEAPAPPGARYRVASARDRDARGLRARGGRCLRRATALVESQTDDPADGDGCNATVTGSEQ